jgi:hypothetical protein
MSGSTGRTWRRLLDDKKAAISRQGCEVPPAITSEASFRNHFETLCRSYRERNYTRLLVNLRYGSINAFASAVDGAFEHVLPNDLAGLVSGVCFVAIKARSPLTAPSQMRGSWTTDANSSAVVKLVYYQAVLLSYWVS